MHTLYALYMQKSKLEERTFSPIYLTRKQPFLWPSAAVRLSVILVQHFAQWRKVLLENFKKCSRRILLL